MQTIKATGLDRKSGGAKPRDLQRASLGLKNPEEGANFSFVNLRGCQDRPISKSNFRGVDDNGRFLCMLWSRDNLESRSL
jgi:hypothetical protein